jgi:hypothetical protein
MALGSAVLAMIAGLGRVSFFFLVYRISSLGNLSSLSFHSAKNLQIGADVAWSILSQGRAGKF